MNRFPPFFETQRRTGRKALSLFLTAGFPSLEDTCRLLPLLQDAGADILEVGIPFSDPIADGSVIQHSSEVALRQGISLGKIFDAIKKLRPNLHIPIVLMGYANPVYSFGFEKFLQTCAETGIDGAIIPDLSLEEGWEFRKLARQYDIATILLVTPTSPPHRIRQIDQESTGFLYCVSLTGVTGSRLDQSDGVAEFLNNVRGIVSMNPLLAGFGIATPEDARRVSAYCDGVIVGSALVRLLEVGSGDMLYARASEFTRHLRSAIDQKSL